MTSTAPTLAAMNGTRMLADLESGAVTAVELLERHLALLDGPGAALNAVQIAETLFGVGSRPARDGRAAAAPTL